MPKTNNFKTFILAHSFRGFGLWSAGSIALVLRLRQHGGEGVFEQTAHLTVAEKQR